MSKSNQQEVRTPYMIVWRERNREHHRKWMREYARKRRLNPLTKELDKLTKNRPGMKEKCLKWAKEFRKNNPDYEKKRSQTLQRSWIIKQLKKKGWPITEDVIISYTLILKIKRHAKNSQGSNKHF